MTLPTDFNSFLLLLISGGGLAGVVASHLLEFLWPLIPSITATVKQVIVVLVTVGIVAGAMALLSQPALVAQLQPFWAIIVSVVGGSALVGATVYHSFRIKHGMAVAQKSIPPVTDAIEKAA